MKKIYQVFVNDVWDNNYLIGFFKNLDDAIPEINDFIEEDEWKLEPGDLKESAGTFGPIFDTQLVDILESKGKDREELYDSDEGQLSIRGFILEYENSLDELIE